MENKKFKVVLTDYEWADLKIENEIFNRPDVEFVSGKCFTEESVIEIVKDADAVISEVGPISLRAIENMPNCKIISLNAIGFNNVDIQAATKAGVMVVNCPDYCLDEVSDHAMALFLSCARAITIFDQKVRHKIWDFKSAGKLNRLKDLIFGLLGFGNIARQMVKKAQAFGLKVIAHDPYLDDSLFKAYGVERVSFESLFQRSDFLSIHTPLTPETHNLVSIKAFEMMKETVYLINAGRGELIDEKALYIALINKKIAGAALDVLVDEPPKSNNPLFQCDNLILTPHVAFYSEQSISEVRTRSAEQVLRVLDGGKPDHIVNPEVLKSYK